MKETTPAAMPPCFDKWCQRFDDTAYSRFMKYTALSRGFFRVLASLLILLLETRLIAIYIYMEYAVSLIIKPKNGSLGTI
ncbi:hypothetical protein QUA16_25220 [Microcoleus sp. S13_C3]